MRFHRFELRKANGNLSNTVAGVLGDWTYTYDAQNRLIRATGGPSSVVAEFYYDARNRCVKRVINGVTTYLIYDGWSLLEERNLAGNLLARYYHGPVIDELLCRVTETNTVYYHHDGLGSTIALTDSTGSVVESYTYDVYGQPFILSTTYHLLPTSAVTNRFLFTGREYLADLALYDYRHRFYSPSLGRFLQTDPLRFDAEDVNLYRYVGDNPILYSDYEGLQSPGVGGQPPKPPGIPPGYRGGPPSPANLKPTPPPPLKSARSPSPEPPPTSWERVKPPSKFGAIIRAIGQFLENINGLTIILMPNTQFLECPQRETKTI